MAITITVPRSMYPPGSRSSGRTTRRRKGRKAGRRSARRSSGGTIQGHRAIRVTCVKCGHRHSSIEHLSHGYGSFIRSRRGVGRRRAPTTRKRSTRKRAAPNYNTYIYRG